MRCGRQCQDACGPERDRRSMAAAVPRMAGAPRRAVGGGRSAPPAPGTCLGGRLCPGRASGIEAEEPDLRPRRPAIIREQPRSRCCRGGDRPLDSGRGIVQPPRGRPARLLGGPARLGARIGPGIDSRTPRGLPPPPAPPGRGLGRRRRRPAARAAARGEEVERDVVPPLVPPRRPPPSARGGCAR
jgi:hypothetical protein